MMCTQELPGGQGVTLDPQEASSSKYELFLQEGREGVDPEKGIFHNIYVCNENADVDGVCSLMDIINDDDETIESYEYIDLLRLSEIIGFDFEILGNKIVKDLLKRNELTEKEARHLRNQIRFQDDKDRGTKPRRIEAETCARILELIGKKKIIKTEEEF